MSRQTLEQRLSKAVAQFWRIRRKQQKKGGGDSKAQYAGTRGAVVGGSHLDGLVDLVRALLVEGGLPRACVYPNEKSSALPGFFRPTKEWDLVVVSSGKLIATIEFKSQVGSFGNNFNNRVEEALGNATDLQTAYRDGAFKPSPAPWLGYMMLLEYSPRSTKPVRVAEPHFKVFKEWNDASYVRRYELFCQKLVRERLYDAACFITSAKKEGLKGIYHEPNQEIGFKAFAGSLIGHVAGIARTQRN
jgi:hypothetical protein